MKKISIILLFLAATWLGLDYYALRVQARNQNLIADAYDGNLERLKEDLEDGADLNYMLYFSDTQRDYTDVTFNALHAAASSGNEDVINYLLEQKMDINAQTPDGWTPLFIAARDGRSEAAKLLIFRGADTNVQTDLGATALLMAATQPYPTEEKRAELVTYLLENEADPDLATINNLPVIYYAAVTGRLPVVELLLEYQALVTRETYQKITAYLQQHPSKTSRKITALLKKAVTEK